MLDIMGLVMEKGTKVSLREDRAIPRDNSEACARCGQSLCAYRTDTNISQGSMVESQ
jgi:hypothetical protein